MHAILRKKNMQRKSKSKRIKMLLNMVTSMFLGDVGVIGCISKVIVPIKQLWLCASVFDLLIFQIVIIWGTYALLLCFHTQMQILCYFWYMGRYNVIWPLQGIHVSIYAHYTVLTCFWNIKLVRPVVCVCVCFGSWILCIYVKRCFEILYMLFGSMVE